MPRSSATTRRFVTYDERYYITAKLLQDTHRLPELVARAAGPLKDVTVGTASFVTQLVRHRRRWEAESTERAQGRPAATYMPAEAWVTAAGGDRAGFEDAERFVFGADPVRERWTDRPLAETRGWLELARLMAGRAVRRRHAARAYPAPMLENAGLIDAHGASDR